MYLKMAFKVKSSSIIKPMADSIRWFNLKRLIASEFSCDVAIHQNATDPVVSNHLLL